MTSLQDSVTTILIRYGETGLKGEPVRSRFEKLLVENLVLAHKVAGVSCLFERQRGRIFASSDMPEKTLDILARTFGVVSVSPVEECSSDPEEISKLAVVLSSTLLKSGASFAVRARRTGDHSYSSMELAATVGERILEANRELGIRVDLSNPDFEIFIEVRNNRAFVFSKNIPGPGGLPLRSQGRVLALIEDKKSLLAAWLMMRRGCTTILLNQSNLTAREIEILKPWNPWWSGFIESTDPMEILRLKNCLGIVVGWTLDEFEIRERPKAGVPIFYPLLGMNRDEIERRISDISR